MNGLFRILFLDSQSDNLKSKTCAELRRRIKNLKSAGIFAIGVTFAMYGAVAQAQEQKKIPRVGFLAASTGSGESSRPAARFIASSSGRISRPSYRRKSC